MWFLETKRGPFELAVGAAAMVAVTVAAANLLTPERAPARLIMVVVAAGVCAAVLSRVRSAVVVAGLGYLLFVGFLVDGPGELTGQRPLGQGEFLAFAFAVLVGAGHRRLRAVRADADLDAALHHLLDSAGPAGDDDERPGG